MTDTLERYRRRAKSLKKSFASGDPEAMARARAVMPGGGMLTHSAALHVVAREAGYASWPKLKFALETAVADDAALAEALKQALFNGVHWRVEQILARAPGLPERHFALLCALCRPQEVRSWLQRDPGIVHRAQLGPRVPLLHLAFSRHFQAHPELEAQMLEVAQLLLEAGADVNAGFPASPGSPHLLSALYGAIGHAGNMALGRWLLAQGASPDDGESLYHATELGHHEGLEMLLAAGADPSGTNALLRALDFDDAGAVRLLLDHGADVNEFDATPVDGEAPWVLPALHQAARRMCSAETVSVLLDSGADLSMRHAGALPYTYAKVYGNAALAEGIAARGGAAELSAAEDLLAAAAEDRLPEGARLDQSDVPAYAQDLIRDILHLPGKTGHVQRLVSLGLDADRPDREGLTPLHISGWEGLPGMMEYFLSQGSDLAHINGYGGNLVTTILHGAENCPARKARGHASCMSLALEAGLPLGRNLLDHCSDPALLRVMEEWAEANPDRLLDNVP
jgi:ankyrin repeat protein